MPDENMTLAQRHALGVETQSSIFGPANAPDATTWQAEADLQAMWADICFADSWARPALDLRTKSMLSIAMLLARGAARELIRHHVAGGLKLGITRDEMTDLFIHVTAYCGAPSTAGVWPWVRDLMVESDDSGEPDA